MEPTEVAVADAHNPYVGPRSIAYGESIYGRDVELNELQDTLISQRIVLVYSPSGAGKSSLLEAGLRPRLEKRRFHIFPTIRIGHLEADVGNRYIVATMLALTETMPPGRQPTPEQLAEMTIDELLTEISAEVVDDDLDVCLFFDQFEELFTLDPTDQDEKAEFLQQLGIALRNRGRWALFAMREDFIAQLDPYASLIPTRLSTRVRLDLLDVESARQAARQPALDAGVNFTVEAADRLIDDLRRVRVRRGDAVSMELGPSVEPVQLQVVCRRLWNRVVAS